MLSPRTSGFLMKSAVTIIVLAACTVQTHGVTPVQRVIRMMEQMLEKAQAQKKEETATYDTYHEWKKVTARDLGFSIETSKTKRERLTATIAKLGSDIKDLARNIAKLDNEIDRMEKQAAENQRTRQLDHTDFLANQKDLEESVAALEGAITEISTNAKDAPQAEALLQTMAKDSMGMRRVLVALENQKRDDGAPEVAAYKSQSGGILALLKQLHGKFRDQLADLQNQEANEKQSSDMELLHQNNIIVELKSDREERSSTKAQKMGEKAKAEADKAQTEKSLADDEATLAELTSTFAQKTDAYNQNQGIRKNEIAALKKAIEIMSSSAVETYHKNIKAIQLPGASFLQVRSTEAVKQQRAVRFLQGRARALSSSVLSTVIQNAANSPFDKVISMIKNLLEKLKENASAEAEHKKWCDEQLNANKLKREKKTAVVDKLAAQIEADSANIATDAASIATLESEMNDLTTAMTEATKIRQDEKAKNLKTIEEAKAGMKAVNAAIGVLKKFYEAHGSFAQQVPEMAAYNGQQSASGGIIGMLEVIATDFSRLDAETTAAEAQAASEYDKFMDESKTSKQQKHKLAYETGLEKDQTEFEKGENEKDHRAVSKELERANAYYETLKPSCLQVHVNYSDRVKAREDEIKALKEAYEILSQKS